MDSITTAQVVIEIVFIRVSEIDIFSSSSNGKTG